jgi:hypothetical protein
MNLLISTSLALHAQFFFFFASTVWAVPCRDEDIAGRIRSPAHLVPADGGVVVLHRDRSRRPEEAEESSRVALGGGVKSQRGNPREGGRNRRRRRRRLGRDGEGADDDDGRGGGGQVPPPPHRHAPRQRLRHHPQG